MDPESPHQAQVRWFAAGLALVLLSGPIGDFRRLLYELVWAGFSQSSSHDRGYSTAQLDRMAGWLVLLAGWLCIARGLYATWPRRGSVPRAPGLMPAGALRWLPVPVVATAAVYALLAYHRVPPLVLTVDVLNAPANAELQVGVKVMRTNWTASRYGATFDNVFNVQLPPYSTVQRTSNQAHNVFEFQAGLFSLQNWQPDLEVAAVKLRNASERKAAEIALLRHDHAADEPILVNRATLQPCRSTNMHEDLSRGSSGSCLLQEVFGFFRSREVHVQVDLAGVELTPYTDPPFYNLDFVEMAPR